MNLTKAIAHAEKMAPKEIGGRDYLYSTLVYYVHRWNDGYCVSSGSFIKRHPHIKWVYNTKDKAIMADKEIIEIAEQRGDMELLFDFTRIVAHSDSIGEGHRYCAEYTKKAFNEEIKDIKGEKSDCQFEGYLEYAGLEIYTTHLKHIGWTGK